MIKKLRTFIALLAIAGIMSSCSVTLPVTATGNEIGDKVGTSQAFGLFDGVLWVEGDASITTAAENGGISKISTIDQKTTIIMGLTWYETIVTGE